MFFLIDCKNIGKAYDFKTTLDFLLRLPSEHNGRRTDNELSQGGMIQDVSASRNIPLSENYNNSVSKTHAIEMHNRSLIHCRFFFGYGSDHYLTVTAVAVPCQ